MRKEKVVEEEVETKEDEFLEDSQEEEFQEGKELDEVIGFRAKKEDSVEEDCIGHVIIEKSILNFEELLSKDPFAITLCPNEAKPSAIPLG
ncbi:unnamed protein product [Linum trigynum]|uniref:Uncharacterized protein n=1 Tax=Linum trigynum TaxID=586398 RepID=A0AAV2E1T1_9ROSI